MNFSKEILNIISEVEKKINVVFEPDELERIYQYTRRKCMVNGEGESYVPILFENELRDHVARARVTALGRFNRVMKQGGALQCV